MSEAPVNHSSDQELRDLSVGQLRDEELARVSAHLAGCPECCRRIDELGADDPLLARLQQSAAPREEVLVPPAQRRSAVRALRGTALKWDGSSDTPAQKTAQESHPTIPAPQKVGDYDILAEVG